MGCLAYEQTCLLKKYYLFSSKPVLNSIVEYSFVCKVPKVLLVPQCSIITCLAPVRHGRPQPSGAPKVGESSSKHPGILPDGWRVAWACPPALCVTGPKVPVLGEEPWPWPACPVCSLVWCQGRYKELHTCLKTAHMWRAQFYLYYSVTLHEGSQSLLR